jgi:peptidoglycan/LPS O-acetylase OafA/YrhL
MRIARLDGLRGIAIALVIAFHALHFSFGWIGVDLFFVLSGYLVTAILRRDRGNDIYWKPFYIKRATRILPPFLVALLLCAIFYRQEWHELRYYYLFTLANFGLIPYEGGKAFGALWSLSVEEHFYLLWPLAIRRLGSRVLVPLLLCVLFIEPIARGVITPFTHTYWITYALTPFRLDGLAAGALLAITLESPPKWLASWSGRVGIAALLVITGLALTHHFNSKDNTVFFNIFGYTLTAIGSASLLAFTLLHERSWVSSVLENRVLTFLGTISYGLYLFHPFIFSRFAIVAEHYGWHHHAVLLPIALPFALVLCWLSFRFFELPMISLGHRWAKLVKASGAHHSERDAAQPLNAPVEIGAE